MRDRYSLLAGVASGLLISACTAPAPSASRFVVYDLPSFETLGPGHAAGTTTDPHVTYVALERRRDDGAEEVHVALWIASEAALHSAVLGVEGVGGSGRLWAPLKTFEIDGEWIVEYSATPELFYESRVVLRFDRAEATRYAVLAMADLRAHIVELSKRSNERRRREQPAGPP